MEDLISTAKKEVLVEMVKLAQKREMAGSKGQWKEFLKFYDKKFGSSLSDPSRRSIDSLVAFLKTFEQDEDLKLFKKVVQCHSNRALVEELKKENPDSETAEQELVRLTLEHPLYPVEYSFPSHEEEWGVVKCSEKSKAKKSAHLISIDCEMVLCEDGTEALVKVCAVDRNLQVKLDKVVNPNKAIADYRTDITGISAKDLDEVTHSLKDVQKSVKKLLRHGTILVGHSANNDLQALKVDHTRVIDTSYIFKHAKSNRKPSLSLLCKTKLGYELREKGKPHNCLDDACAAMKLVLARLEGKIDSVIISDEVKELDVAKLLVHRIPFNILSTDLKSLLPGDCTIEVKVGIKVKNTYSAFAIYKSQQEAIEAFENLEGDFAKDSYGRPQKLVNFELDSGETVTLCVCKTFEDDAVGLLSKKRLGEDESVGKSKKLKTDQTSRQLEDSTNQCDAHLEEIGRLKKELKQRDKEISSLNKIIAALARKQGL
ncbi:Small RNA degrading nuclease 3 [Striga hermonthica]|uniref:Small RNA degrading nuclease 3 n=1 Tax=Striga hermonthica TaxID=68872 RepID=A0A9N7NQX6_STRHE|nr:Small RNA degrading nuclease 3 [Striga hermonthica]